MAELERRIGAVAAGTVSDMRLRLLAACVLALATAALAAPAASAEPSVIRFFQTPSKRIHCAYLSAARLPPLRYRRRLAATARAAGELPGRLGDRASPWEGRSRPVVCAGDTTAYPSARVVGYGKTWARGGFRCEVRRRGLTCENAADHGFFLSASSWRRF